MKIEIRVEWLNKCGQDITRKLLRFRQDEHGKLPGSETVFNCPFLICVSFRWDENVPDEEIIKNGQ